MDQTDKLIDETIAAMIGFQPTERDQMVFRLMKQRERIEALEAQLLRVLTLLLGHEADELSIHYSIHIAQRAVERGGSDLHPKNPSWERDR